MAESEEELKSLLRKMKEESEKVGLKLNIQKTKIMASGPINSWHIDEETWKQCQTLFLGAPKSLQMVIAAMKFPGGSDGKVSACNAGDLASIPVWGRSPGEGNGNPLQHSCLENPTDWGAWQATVHGVAKSQTRLSDFTSLHFTYSLEGKLWPT